MSTNAFIQAIGKRRSIYALGKSLPIPKEKVVELVKATVRQCPSSFNVQSARIVILYGADHDKVWDIVNAAFKRIGLPDEQYAASEQKVNGCFKAGAGTVLFYEDGAAIEQQQKDFPTYATAFPAFSEHSSAIAQYAVWTMLAQENIGASLQHYNQLIESDLRDAFDIPAEWKLIAQMPFGSINAPAGEKTHLPDEKRFRVIDQ